MFENVAFFIFTEVRCGQAAFKIIANPLAFLAVFDVHVFDADMFAIRLFQFADDVGQGEFGGTAEIAFAQAELHRHVRIGQTVCFRLQAFHVARRFQAQRVEFGSAGTLNAVGGNQAQYGNLFLQQVFVNRAGSRGNIVAFCQIGERFLNRAVRHVALDCAGQCRQFAKIALPFRADGIGIA